MEINNINRLFHGFWKPLKTCTVFVWAVAQNMIASNQMRVNTIARTAERIRYTAPKSC